MSLLMRKRTRSNHITGRQNVETFWEVTAFPVRHSWKHNLGIFSRSNALPCSTPFFRWVHECQGYLCIVLRWMRPILRPNDSFCRWTASMRIAKRIKIYVWSPTLCPGSFSWVCWMLACVCFLLSLQFMENFCETDGNCSNSCQRRSITTTPAVAKSTINSSGSVYSISGYDSRKKYSTWKKIRKCDVWMNYKIWNGAVVARSMRQKSLLGNMQYGDQRGQTRISLDCVVYKRFQLTVRILSSIQHMPIL